MATTGFWPVRSSLGAVIAYADNPDKTTNPKYLDDDLAQVLRYAGNDDKTDQWLFVTGVHCTAEHAYEDMSAVQKRFGLKGQIVAYHGYQSFKPGEVTPEQEHQIGIETAKQMWGDRFQVLVTTHLNTDSIHNHMVVNAVSYRDGKKFQNHIRDHIRLREISDRICRERRLSVLENAPFYSGRSRGAYWAEKQGKEISGNPLETLMVVTLFTGMRQGEIMGLTWDCVDFIRGTLTVNKQLQYYGSKGGGYKLVSTKNGKSRVIVPASFVMGILRKHKSTQASVAAESRSCMGAVEFRVYGRARRAHENVERLSGIQTRSNRNRSPRC